MSNPVGRTHTFRSQKYFSERVPATFAYAGIDGEPGSLLSGKPQRSERGPLHLGNHPALPYKAEWRPWSRRSKPPFSCTTTGRDAEKITRPRLLAVVAALAWAATVLVLRTERAMRDRPLAALR